MPRDTPTDPGPAPPAAPPPPRRADPVAEHEAVLRARLRAHKAVATGLLVVMAAIVVLTHVALPDTFWTRLLRACAEAGLVGGLADWFAVTALFRRPLGLPIPHTAIVPNQKARLGEALGRFVANHVFTEAEVARVLARLDLAGVLRGFLADPEATRPAARAVAGSLPRLLARVEDGRAARLAVRLLPRLADGPATARVAARALRALVEGGRHHAVFDLVLAEIRRVLRDKEASLREEIERRVRGEGGALVGWVAGAYVSRRAIGGINEALDDALASDSNLRAAFDAWVLREIERLETDPDRAAQIGRAVRGALRHAAVAGWLEDAWGRVRTAVEADAARPEGRIAALVGAALSNAGAMLAEDARAREALNAALTRAAIALLPRARAQLSGFIASVVAGWDTATITERVELRVGRDLQFVRMNGTLVGALAGGALFLVVHALFGHGGSP